MPLEVEMRLEQVITAVTRPVVVATVRELKVVVSFVRNMTLQLCKERKSLGMPAYSSGFFMAFMNELGGRRGRLCLEPMRVDAACWMGKRNA